MDEIHLAVQVREKKGTRKIKSIFRDECIPAVVYGGNKPPTTIQVQRGVYEKIQREHKGGNVVFHLDVMEGEKKLRDYSAVVKQEQHEPVSYKLHHIDFLRISLKEAIEVKVPIEVVGESVGVKQDGGSIDQPMWELDVVCLPTNIPQSIKIDVTELKIGDSIHVKDLVLPEGVKSKHDEEAMLVSCVPPMKEEAAEEGEEGELTEPEVTKEKKEEEGSGEKTEGDAPAEEKSEG